MFHSKKETLSSRMTSLALMIMLVTTMLIQVHANPAASEIAFYEKSMTAILKEHSDDLEKLGKKYIAALESSAKKFQKAGDLDALLSINSELENFKKNGAIPIKDNKKPHQETLRMRALYSGARLKVDKEMYQSASKLNGNFLYFLENMQKKLTQEGKLEDALLIRAEIDKIKKSQASIPSKALETNDPPPQKPQQQIIKGAQQLISWDGSRRDDLIGPDGRPTNKYKFSHEGKNRLDGSILHLSKGRTLIEGANQQLLEACKKTDELSLFLHMETQNLKQSGPARILSFSLNSVKRNFTIGQDNENLVLRLRTTKTGENGSNPEVVLSKLEPGQKKKIVITYRPGQLEAYIDGKSVTIQKVDGDFSNWEECSLVLGNEWKDERPWEGRIHQFSIYSSVLQSKDALALSK